MKKSSIFLALLLISGKPAQSQHTDYNGKSVTEIMKEMRQFDSDSGPFEHPLQVQKNAISTSKSATDIVLQLDSITSHETYRVEFSYNIEGKVVSSTQYVYDPGTSVYGLGMKEEFTYDNNVYLIERLRQQWNPLADGWENQALDEFEFNIEGNELLSQSSYWSLGSAEWIATQRREQTFDEEGRLAERVEFAEDPVPGSALIPQFKFTYTYDGDGLLTEKLQEIREENESDIEVWLLFRQQLYSYENGLTDTIFINSWSADDEDWQISRKRTFTYDGELETLSLNETWNPIEEMWIETGKIEREYSSSGLETTITHFIMEEDGWRPVLAFEYMYGAGDNAEQHNVYVWDQGSQQLYLSSAAEYSFDLDYEIEEIATPDTYNNNPLIKNKPVNLSLTSFLSNGFVVSQIEDEFHYSAFTTLSTSHSEDSKLRLYPNPATDFVNISSENQSSPTGLELFDLQGRRVMDVITMANEQISVAEIPKGLYIYRLNGGSEIRNTGKLIKQ